MRFLGLVLVLVLSFRTGTSQQSSSATLVKTYNWKSSALLRRLQNQLSTELDRNNIERESPLGKEYVEISDDLQQLVKDSLVLDNPGIQWLLDITLKQLLEANPALQATPKTVLTYSDPLPNAYCVGEGTIMITTGFLSRMQNQSQLASLLSHELAHYQLNHVRRRIELGAIAKMRTRWSWSRSKTKDPVIDNVRDLKQRMTYLYAEYRKLELAADSLEFIYMSKAGFKETECLTLLEMLDPGSGANVDVRSTLFTPLYNSKFPFKESWLRDRAPIYSKSTLDFFLPDDMMRTHPEIKIRVDVLRKRVTEKGQLNYVADDSIRKVAAASLLQGILVGPNTKVLDQALYEALIALGQYPDNKYLVTAMGRVLLRTVRIFNDNSLVYNVPLTTAGYDKEMLLVNNFIFNISEDELIEMGYHFMRKNFSNGEPDHYYLLWRFCQLTDRREEMRKVGEEYRAKFPKGVYKRIFK